VAHLRHFDLLLVLQATRELDFFCQDLPLNTDSFALRANNLREAASTLALRTALLNTVVANNAASATALETLARAGPSLRSCALTRVAQDALIELQFEHAADDSIDETHFNLSFQISASRVIPSHPLLSCLPLEVKELIKFVKDLLLEVLFVRTSASTRPLFSLGLLPELVSCLLLLPSIEGLLLKILTTAAPTPWHRSFVRTTSPIEVVVFIFTVLLIVRENGAIRTPLSMRVIVAETASSARGFGPKPVLIVIQLLFLVV